MIPQFCMCNAQAGYPHKWFCPFPYYPYYGADRERMEEWMRAAEEKRMQAVTDRETGGGQATFDHYFEDAFPGVPVEDT